MKTLYLDCQMGAAGDMLLAALLELLPDKENFLHTLNSLGLPGVCVTAEPAVRCGLTGTHVTVKVCGQEEHEHTHGHSHSTLSDIHRCIDHLPVSESVRVNAKAVYDRIADAESRVHGQPVEAVHFHEVGAWDAVTDVVGVCLAMEQLDPDLVISSPVHVGSGSVRCAHGLLPVPAPATALLLQNVPIYGGSISGELCTPTGAALLTHFVTRFGDMPVLSAEKIGCGMGTKEFPQANCLRAFWGTTQCETEPVTELSCNLDDMTPEAIGFAQERLWEAGALDVYTTAIGMKKSRPGVQLTCICRPEQAEKLADVFLRHTSTLGVRRRDCCRYTLQRTTETVSTPHGEIRVKHADGHGVSKSKAEYEDLAAIARKLDIPLAEVLQLLK